MVGITAAELQCPTFLAMFVHHQTQRLNTCFDDLAIRITPWSKCGGPALAVHDVLQDQPSMNEKACK